MALSGSYQLSRVTADIEVELKRLRAQIDLFWTKELQRYLAFGLQDGMSILDAGSGPGYLTAKLLRLFPSARVVAVEQDPLMVEKANIYLQEQGFGEVSVLERSALATGLPENTFDFAIARLLLEHLAEPLAGAREIHRLLKPGGRAVFVDNDFDLYTRTYPPVKALKAFFDAYCQSREAEGGHPRIGRRLPILLEQARYRNIDFDVLVAHNAILGDQAFSASEGMSIPLRLVQEGFLPSTALGELVREWREMLRTQGHVIVRQLFICMGEK